jgi:hypothetical protein
LSRDAEVSRQGSYSAKISLTTDYYSGISLSHFPGDWSGRAGLAFSVFNLGREITLHYRVHDMSHRGYMQEHSNRFNGETVLYLGWNDIVIPMTDILHGLSGRTMDVTKTRTAGGQVLKYHICCISPRWMGRPLTFVHHIYVSFSIPYSYLIEVNYGQML